MYNTYLNIKYEFKQYNRCYWGVPQIRVQKVDIDIDDGKMKTENVVECSSNNYHLHLL